MTYNTNTTDLSYPSWSTGTYSRERYPSDINIYDYDTSQSWLKTLEWIGNMTNKPNKIEKENKSKESENNNMFDNLFNGMFKQITKGCCKIGMNGEVAVKTSNGYKTFDIKTNKLTNCDNFAFDADGAFWVVPTFSVEKGDIILVNGKPRCVIDVKENSIKTFSYEDSNVNEMIPEQHMFMGKAYCYGKIFSPFMNMSKSDDMMKNMMMMSMMSQMFGGNGSSNTGMMGMNPMMFMMMNGDSNPFAKMFDGAFNFGSSDKSESEVK